MAKGNGIVIVVTDMDLSTLMNDPEILNALGGLILGEVDEDQTLMEDPDVDLLDAHGVLLCKKHKTPIINGACEDCRDNAR